MIMKQEQLGTKSFWNGTNTVKLFPALEQDLETDVCIVGAGITGLSCAYFLSKENVSVVVLDDGEIGSGETFRTTGHLTYALDDRFYDLIDLFGVTNAQLALESHRTAVDRIEQITIDEQINCDFERVNGYLFLHTDDKPETLSRELDALHQLNLSAARIVQRAPIQSFDTGPCIFFPNQAEFDVVKYINGLTNAITKRGGLIYNFTPANSFETHENSCLVKTRNGHTINSKYLIIATNSPINDRFVIHTKEAAYRTYVIAGKIPRTDISKGLYWDTGDPYHYIRVCQLTSTDPDFATHFMLLIGGEDTRTGQDHEYEERFQNLKNWSKQRFPALKEITYQWSGQILEPVDSLAFIGRNPLDSKNVFIGTGDSGNGLTHGTIAGMLITDLIMGRTNPWEKIYDPSRKTLNAMGSFFEENLNTANQYLDWITPEKCHHEDQIERGTGSVIQNGIHKIAVYKDHQGNLYPLSARCTHFNGEVHWNPIENSWDCPCHGSRFDVNGEVLCGPALHGLEKVNVEQEKRMNLNLQNKIP